jgi:hypothetical protein
MGSGGSAVDAMVIGCLDVDRRAERFFSYLAILSLARICDGGRDEHYQTAGPSYQ